MDYEDTCMDCIVVKHEESICKVSRGNLDE